MERRTDIPELLAPAGSREAFEAAVAAGADAVYLSGTRFGARAYATNFDDDALREVISDAHGRGIRVYVTANTLLSDDEIPDVGDYLLYLYRIGTDAILVQDQGVLRIARIMLPDLLLHASTQMTIHSTEGLRYAARKGISRIVLARELTLDEVREITRQADALGVGIEVFAHGALCMGYSGQCLLSSVIGGRSGNRGSCAQPCRRLYQPVIGNIDPYGRPVIRKGVNTEPRYLLSPRDLAICTRLPEVITAGVAALKIEGRMKSPAYVATVVSLYRKALDQIASGTFVPDEEALCNSAFVFSRGFTEGHLFGAKGTALVSEDRPDSRGVRFGTVTWYDRNKGEAVIGDLSKPYPERGDGVVFYKDGEDDVGCDVHAPVRIREGTLRLKTPVPVKTGMDVAINKRRAVEEDAAGTIASYNRGGGRKVEIELSISMEGDHLRLDGYVSAPWGGGITISARSSSPMVPAETRPVTEETIIDLMTRTGETGFTITIHSILYPGGLFLPIRVLTELRRDLISAAEAALRAGPPRELEAAEERWRDCLRSMKDERRSERVDTPILAIYASSMDEVAGALDGGATRIYYEPAHPIASCEKRTVFSKERWQETVLHDLSSIISLCNEHGATCFWKFPEITRKRFLDYALPILGEASARGLRGVMVGGVGMAEAIREIVPDIEIAGSSGLNLMNRQAIEEMKPDHQSLSLSHEISYREVQRLGISGGEVIELFVQGSVPAMITEHCPAQGRFPCPGGGDVRLSALADHTGRLFPVRVDAECRTIISNAVETCLIDHLHLILDAGVAILGIEVRGRTKTYARIVCRAYHEALAAGAEELKALKEEIRMVAWGGITTGQFLQRGDQ
ncbi:hypothetical protein RJ53_01315 [Methanocalculus chunghsingensis]|uniref:Peptidase U32 collagenase domain-containing protein n=1 Tax=Methanocalculus chunghsingensis TaxID=156457 RepID=A0A8J8B4L6_9EURY|nr:U32 family peptidase [Methanocalculus chunghsingensis]MBR1368203.1 hypothetical protein [Methanocalculus chunghsingensis]